MDLYSQKMKSEHLVEGRNDVRGTSFQDFSENLLEKRDWL